MDLPVGLDQDSLAVYRAVLLHQEQAVPALAKHLALPEDRVRTAVHRLIGLSLLTPSWDQPGNFRAVSPTLGLEVLIQQEQRELADRQWRIEQNRAALAALAAEYTAQGEAGGLTGTERLVGMDQIRTRLEMLSEDCRSEALAIHPSSILSEEGTKAAQPLNQRALDRGVRFRSIYLDSITKERATLEYVRWVRERGGEIRTAPSLPMRLLIVDNRCVVVGEGTEDGRPTALVLANRTMVTAMTALFESYWKHATRLGVPAPPDDGGLTPQERELIRLLASGAKDDAIARALGIGLRTERRMVAELSERIGASSRFELGAKAARAGWL
ncbi:LuxR family transcriptional regulator [Streptomyces sp. NPDC051322]|uniref:helix-turn-helix transcriptional regulator n=1 Tax=Streptomyces sp. NPDC051322 TaxID=3154645 RepID=UPI0034507069